ncbi:MAG: cytochrome c peroxidase [Planctomycetota bacterium]|jgi:cytochrome c peroxidase
MESKTSKLKKKHILLAVPVVLILFALFMPISNLVFTPERPAIPLHKMQDQYFVKAGPVLQHKCVDCHSARTAKPWYFSMPIAKAMISRDIDGGVEALDITEALFASKVAFSQVQLAKIESVMFTGTMPPTRYVMMHWDTWVSQEEKDNVRSWVQNVRARKFASPNVAKELAGEVVQPIPLSVIVDLKKEELGNKLFHDKRLSADDTISCASCHDLDKGGTDQSQFSTGIDGQVGGINSPTVFNASYNFLQFWDGRAKDLFEQADGHVNNPIEMGSNWEQVIPKIKDDEYYKKAFEELYPEGITEKSIRDAIVEFEKTLITPNSRFDKYLMGEEDAINADEIRGYRTFVDSGCTSCHLGVILGGTHFEKMGRKKDYFAERDQIKDDDQGRYNVTKKEEDRHKFKVPTLRNLAVTYPYFHDGRTKILNEAIGMMAIYQLGEPLTVGQVKDIEKFLLTLTGEYNSKPLKEN